MGILTRRDFIKAAGCTACAAMVSGCTSESSADGGHDAGGGDGGTPGYDAKKLTDDFNSWLLLSGSVIVDLLGAQKGAAALEAIRKNFGTIIPKIPWIGGDQSPNTYNLLGGAYSMGLIKPLLAEGVSSRDIGHSIYLMSRLGFQADKTGLEQKGAGMLTERAIGYMKTGAEWSKKRTYPGDFVFDFVGPQGDYVYGIDMTECAILKFYRYMGLEKYVRYNCLLDYPMYQTMNVRLDRTRTLGNGAAVCDFRYLAAGATPDGWPPENRPEFTGDPA